MNKTVKELLQALEKAERLLAAKYTNIEADVQMFNGGLLWFKGNELFLDGDRLSSLDERRLLKCAMNLEFLASLLQKKMEQRRSEVAQLRDWTERIHIVNRRLEQDP